MRMTDRQRNQISGLTDKQFKAKYKVKSGKKRKRKKRSKKARQLWWKNLGDDKKAEYIEKLMKAKSQKRLQYSINLMNKMGLKYNCNDCFHKITGSCKHNLSRGCQYWCNPNSEIQGIAYTNKQINKKTKKKWKALILNKNQWLKAS